MTRTTCWLLIGVGVLGFAGCARFGEDRKPTVPRASRQLATCLEQQGFNYPEPLSPRDVGTNWTTNSSHERVSDALRRGRAMVDIKDENASEHPVTGSKQYFPSGSLVLANSEADASVLAELGAATRRGRFAYLEYREDSTPARTVLDATDRCEPR